MSDSATDRAKLTSFRHHMFLQCLLRVPRPVYVLVTCISQIIIDILPACLPELFHWDMQRPQPALASLHVPPAERLVLTLQGAHWRSADAARLCRDACRNAFHSRSAADGPAGAWRGNMHKVSLSSGLTDHAPSASCSAGRHVWAISKGTVLSCLPAQLCLACLMDAARSQLSLPVSGMNP